MSDPVPERRAVADESGARADESAVQDVAPKVHPGPADATTVDAPEADAPSADAPNADAPEADAPNTESRSTDPEPPPSTSTTPPADVRRFRIRAEGGARVIVSGNAPNIRLRVERGLTVDERGRKRHGPQTIFLDGVYSGAPFLNNEARHYSLDHHAGCVRAFTLSTCEQAVVMLLQGLPLSSGMWTLYVNDPDLDSMLAAWILLNHVELLQDDKALLRQLMPVIRLEGVIDAHGTDRELLTGFPPELHAATRARVDSLMEEERALKSEGEWSAIDFVRYAKSALDRIDQGLLPVETLAELARTQESGRASLANGRIAVLIESAEGIYAVEARLKQRYGSNLGVIVLATGPGVYTLRLVDAFLRKDLNAVYRALNKVDPNASPGGDSPNLWGGSGDIGGSPRATGTGLTGQEILVLLESVLGEQPPWYKKIWRFLTGKNKRQPAALPPPE